jgi:hypothetical protein
MREISFSSSSRTGGHESSYDNVAATSKDKQDVSLPDEHQRGKEAVVDAGRPKPGTFTRRSRNSQAVQEPVIGRALELAPTRAPQGVRGRKRGSKQIWMPIPVQVVGDDGLMKDGKRQRKGSVFDRMEVENGGEEGLAPAGSVFNRLEDPIQGRGEGQGNSVFQRLENQSADPAARGRRAQ